MKLSLNWLNDYVDLRDVPVENLVDRLTLAVCEVEGVEEVFAHLDQIHVALVESVEKHPDADRLNVCKVRDGQATHQIVCGAPNVRAGMFAPLAIVGARLPKAEDGEFLEIKPAKLRGVASHGMLCSPGELGLTPMTGEIDGLIDLETLPGLADSGSSAKNNGLKHGTPLSKLLPLKDTVLDIDNKSITHRPDLWCHFGFAREIAAIYGKKLKYDPTKTRAKRQPKTDGKLKSKKIVIESGAAKAYYGRALAGITVAPAPLYMQARLLNVGQRPINNIVDASNYVMLELGQPNHTFDAKTLHTDTVTVALANPSAQAKADAKTKGGAKGAAALSGYKCKSFTTLDGQARELAEDTILILDGPAGAKATPVALGGIMGGENSGVADDTAELFLESATFPRERIRPAIAKLGLRTDSAQRFEKGQDPAKAKLALDRLVELIAESCPDLRQGKTTGASPEKEQRNKITVTLDFLRRRLGFAISDKLVTDILTRLDFEVQVKTKGAAKPAAGGSAKKKKKTTGKPGGESADIVFQLTAPTYRSQYDVSIPEDIVEELGRVFGYDNVEPQAPLAKVEPTPPNRERLLSNRIKTYLATAGGYSEAYGYSFADARDNAAFVDALRYDAWSEDQKTGAAAAKPAPVESIAALALKNPVFMDRPELRLSQLPGLLRQAAGNQNRFSDVRLFEFGRVYYKAPEDLKKSKLATESKRFTLVHLPAASAKTTAAAGSPAELEARSEYRALLELRAFMTRLFGEIAYDGCLRFRAAAKAPAWLHPGAALELVAQAASESGGELNALVLGHAGILHPAVQSAADLKRAAVVADLDFTAIAAIADSARQRIAYRPPSVFPDSHFEISVIMDDREGTHRPVELIEELAMPEIREIRMLTSYRGEPLPADKKSVSYELFAARDGGTLTGEELQTLLDRIVERLAENGFPLR